MEWATAEVQVLGVLIAFFALLATLSYRWLLGHQRDFQMLLQRIDREAEKREQATRATLDRIDREAEKRQQAFDKEAEKREQAIQATLDRIDREAEKREQRIQATMERIDSEAEKRQQAFDKEAEKREQAIQAALERSDTAFETLTARANELTKELAGVAQRTARSEGTLEALAAGEPPGESTSTSTADEPRTVAAQQVPGEPPSE